jgi:hypothetical protein
MARGLPANRRAAEKFGGFVQLIGVPTFVTIVLAGIWHGAGLQYVVFGLLHAAYLIVNHAWRIFGPRVARSHGLSVVSAANVLWRVVLTYLSVLLAQIFFRADNVHDALLMLGGAIGRHGDDLPLAIRAGSIVGRLGPLGIFLTRHGVFAPGQADAYLAVTQPLLVNGLLILGLSIVVWGTPNVYQILAERSPALQKVAPARWHLILWRPNLAWAMGGGLALFFALTRLEHPGRFLYFQF